MKRSPRPTRRSRRFRMSAPDLGPDLPHQKPDGIDIGVIFEIAREDNPLDYSGTVWHFDPGKCVRIHHDPRIRGDFARDSRIFFRAARTAEKRGNSADSSFREAAANLGDPRRQAPRLTPAHRCMKHGLDVVQVEDRFGARSAQLLDIGGAPEMLNNAEVITLDLRARCLIGAPSPPCGRPEAGRRG